MPLDHARSMVARVFLCSTVAEHDARLHSDVMIRRIPSWARPSR